MQRINQALLIQLRAQQDTKPGDAEAIEGAVQLGQAHDAEGRPPDLADAIVEEHEHVTSGPHPGLLKGEWSLAASRLREPRFGPERSASTP